MRIGSFRHQIQFVTEVTTPDGMGGQTQLAPDVTDPIPCSIDPVGAGERYKGHRLQTEASAVIMVRHQQWTPSEIKTLTDATAVNSVSGKLYTIQAAYDPDELRRWLMIEVLEVVGK